MREAGDGTRIGEARSWIPLSPVAVSDWLVSGRHVVSAVKAASIVAQDGWRGFQFSLHREDPIMLDAAVSRATSQELPLLLKFALSR